MCTCQARAEQEETSQLKMKFLSLITVVALAVSVSGDCSTCEDGVNAIMQSMSTSNDITGAVVKDACCPSQDDPESCNTAVDTWWPAISAAMAASENMAPITCAVLDCGDAAKAWDCDTCKARLEDVWSVTVGPVQNAALAQYLKGPAFCGSFICAPLTEDRFHDITNRDSTPSNGTTTTRQINNEFP
ncbi:uncharacterized protein LOC131882370 [Tigriopus californicus]|uniref:uncharacterized protein LOC131882370 n=1 Tax=Tigriopus californicus TaxID=6832 RepID=UPI0027DA155D|nr:uncharacterized protein LOC131882370 [Tigriopus californicus]